MKANYTFRRALLLFLYLEIDSPVGCNTTCHDERRSKARSRAGKAGEAEGGVEDEKGRTGHNTSNIHRTLRKQLSPARSRACISRISQVRVRGVLSSTCDLLFPSLFSFLFYCGLGYGEALAVRRAERFAQRRRRINKWKIWTPEPVCQGLDMRIKQGL